jgi:uncharacterized protein YprB with RNaseH-like and TPR domain
MKESFKKRLTRYIEKASLTSESGAGGLRPRTLEPPAVKTAETASIPEERKKRIEELRARLQQISKRRPRPEKKQEKVQPDYVDAAVETGAIPGAMISTAHGPLWESETVIDLRDRYGSIYLLDALGFDGRTASMLGMDEAYGDFDPRRAVYLDTETTGLELATATIPFLVGVGFVEGERFVIKQLFIDRIEKEKQALRYLGDLLGDRGQFVTFNGKTYDIPLLKTRYIFNRLDTHIERWLDLDLLHLVRRIYKRRIQDCSLVSCERNVLGFLRENDIPGDMIPAVYVSFLRENRPGLLPLVFHHNIQDIVAMVALLGSLALLMGSRPDDFESHSADDLLSMARLGMKGGHRHKAEQIWDYMSESGAGTRKVESLVGLARLARRRQEYASAARLLDMALEEEPGSSTIHLMLSKICEHDIQDFPRALEHARSAYGAEDEEKWYRRLQRIEKKMAKNVK